MSSRLERRYAKMPDEKLLDRVRRLERMAEREKVVLLEELSARRIDLPEGDKTPTPPPPQTEAVAPPVSAQEAYARHYANQEDNLLEQLAKKAYQLLPPARAALREELNRRKKGETALQLDEPAEKKYRGPESQRIAADSFPGADRLFYDNRAGYSSTLLVFIIIFFSLIAAATQSIVFVLVGLIAYLSSLFWRSRQLVLLAVYNDRILFKKKYRRKKSRRYRTPKDFNRIEFDRLVEVSTPDKHPFALVFRTQKQLIIVDFPGWKRDREAAANYLNERIREWRRT